MEYTITITTTAEQEDRLFQLADLWYNKTGRPTTKADLLKTMMQAGSSSRIDDAISLLEVNLRNYCKN